ncbi:MAG: glycosyltransferase family 4 protein [Patescibacteria group bacterium]|jgi:glycosyltransferase involved in cell wall biosynthesis
MKPKLAIISDTIRRDLHRPFRYFEHFEIIHLYQKANYGDMTKDDLTGTVQFSGPVDLYRKLNQIKPDIIQAIEPFAGYSRRFRISIKMTLLCKAIYAYSVTHRTPYFFPFFENLSPLVKYGPLMGRIANIFGRIFANRALLIFAINEDAKVIIKSLGVPDNKIVREMWGSWGVDINHFAPSKDKEKDPTLLFVGRIEAMKGVNDLLTAYKTLKPKHPGLKLWMVGDGSMRKEFENLPGVTCFGIIKHKQIPQYFQKAWIFVLPSKKAPDWAEQVGMVNIQAIACGTPVVTTTSGSIPDYMKKEFSVMVPESNHKELAAAIDELLSDKEKRQDFAKHGHEYVIEHYNDKVNVKIFENILKERFDSPSKK